METASAEPEVEAGCSFVEAVRARYGAIDETEYGPGAFNIVDPAKVGKKRMKQWEMVGMEKTRKKQSQHSKLRILVLEDAGIDLAEREEGEIADAQFVFVTELNLSMNVKLSLATIREICVHIPRLQFLNASDIPWPPTPATPRPLETRGPFATITKLVLNRCSLRFFSVVLELQVPTLAELHLEGNGIATAWLPSEGQHSPRFPHVHTLNLGSNQLTSLGMQLAPQHDPTGSSSSPSEPRLLADILAGAFPALRSVSFSCNQLGNISVDEVGGARSQETRPFWPSLKELFLADNPGITSAGTLEALWALCPALESFTITSSSIFPNTRETQSRYLVIASIPSLTKLNHAVVRPKERLDAELMYLQRASAELAIQTNDVAEDDAEEKKRQEELIRERYPRYSDLRPKYSQYTMGSGQPGSVLQMMLKLTFRCTGYADVVLSVPGTITCQKLKALAGSVFKGMITSNIRLSYVTAGDRESVLANPYPLDNELQTLQYYGVTDGCIVLVDDCMQL